MSDAKKNRFKVLIYFKKKCVCAGTLAETVQVLFGANALGDALATFSRLALLFSLQLLGGFLTQQCLEAESDFLVFYKVIKFIKLRQISTHPELLLTLRRHEALFALFGAGGLLEAGAHLCLLALLLLCFALFVLFK